MIGLVFDQNVVLKHWLYQRLAVPFLGYDVQTIGVIRNDTIAAVVAYYNFTKGNCFLSVAAEGFWLTKSTVSICFRYPFVQLGCRRITGLINELNTKSVRFAQKLGFREEGRIRNYYESADALVYGMLKAECKHL